MAAVADMAPLQTALQQAGATAEQLSALAHEQEKHLMAAAQISRYTCSTHCLSSCCMRAALHCDADSALCRQCAHSPEHAQGVDSSIPEIPFGCSVSMLGMLDLMHAFKAAQHRPSQACLLAISDGLRLRSDRRNLSQQVAAACRRCLA